jgi:hypothetical protein
MRKVRALFAILMVLATISLAGCNAWTKATLSECQMEAVKSFGALRKPNEFGVLWPPHELEDYFVTNCMSAHGYILESHPDFSRAGSGKRAVYVNDADNWKRDYLRYLPKFARDFLR